MYHFIINPASRSGKGILIWKKEIEPVLLEKKVEYQSYISQKAGDVTSIVADILAAADSGIVRLVILGGDGTFNEALQGIRDFSRVYLGYIPTGSSNDLAKDLKIPHSPRAVLERILHSDTPYAMDLGSITYEDGSIRHFAVSCGIGFDAAVCEEALHSGMKTLLNKLKLGRLTYLGIALKQLFAVRAVSCRLTLDDNTPVNIRTVLFVTVMNHRYEGGGFQFCPDACDNDGTLNICAVGDIPKPVVLAALPTAFWGKHYFVKGITPYRAGQIKIETSTPLWVHTDGEVFRRADSFTVICLPGCLNMMGI